LGSADTATVTTTSVRYGTVKAFLTATIIGSMAVTFALSFASIIYAGPLAPFLGQGIGLTLVGAMIMAVIGPLMLSYRGTLIQPQDVSTILLSLSASSIAALPAMSAGAAFSTVVALVGITSISTGVAHLPWAG
jgi:sulfate permease, SulP family